MAHVQKFARGSVGGLSNHIERKTENHSNKEIDKERTHENYDLCEKEGDMTSRYQERLRSEEHTSELQSRFEIVCRLLLTRVHIYILFPYTTLFRSNGGGLSMAHVQKFARGSVGGLSNHIERKTENHSNKEIDKERTHENYDLCEKEGDMTSRYQERL